MRKKIERARGKEMGENGQGKGGEDSNGLQMEKEHLEKRYLVF